MAEPIIRRAAAADHDRIRALGQRLVTGVPPWRSAEKFAAAAGSWVEDSLASQHQADHAVWVADVDGVVVGLASASVAVHFTGDRDCSIGELAVSNGWEGRGIGRALVAAAERWAGERGLSAVTLETGAANRAARNFYAGLGFADEQVRLTKPVPRLPD